MPPKQMKAKSLAQRLEYWSVNPEGSIEFEQEVAAAIDSAAESVGFQYVAPSTVDRRHKHLREYELAMQASAKSERVECDDKYIWGRENLEKNVRVYLELAAANVQPRSYDSASASFHAIVQRRQSLMYWVPRKCPIDVKKSVVFNATQEALRHAARKFQMLFGQAEKHFLTKYDLAMLIEYDMWVTQNPEVSQQQHLCWIMGFVFGVRPGTIGFARSRNDQYLQWKDIRITRTTENNFRASVTFRWLKGYREERRKALKFTGTPPKTVDDMFYSIPHRILAILLQRKYLESYKDFESLIAGSEINIEIKAEALELPVILASTPKGNGLEPRKAASGEAISSYVHRRALNFGLPPGITHYAWRRSAATNIARALGTDNAKEALGHNPDSRTFETSYNQGTVAVDLFAVSMDRSTAAPAEFLEDSSVSVNRIKIQSLARRKWIDEYINDDNQYQAQFKALTRLAEVMEKENATDIDIQDYEEARKQLSSMHRTLTKRAQVALHRVEMETTSKNMTTQELEARRNEVRKPGRLQSMLLEAAKAANIEKDDIGQSELYEPDDFYDARDIPDGDVTDDITDDFTEVERQNLTILGPAERNKVDSREDLMAATRTLLEVLTSPRTSEHEQESCNECLDDTTTSDAQKAKTYLPGKLRQHQATDYHSIKSVWFRKHNGTNILCPYGCGTTFSSAKRILDHVFSARTQPDDHLLAAAKDGLFEPIFEGSKATRESAMVIRVGHGETRLEIGDPTHVRLEDLIPPATIPGPRPLVGPRAPRQVPRISNTEFRLPTKAPLAESAYWITHEEGFFGAKADCAQAQNTFIMNLIDTNLREASKGGVTATGAPRTHAFKGAKRYGGMNHLRDRLESLGFGWAQRGGEDDLEEIEQDIEMLDNDDE